MLIEEYFQSIGDHITDCPYVAESQIRNDRRSFYIGIVEGEIRFTDNSFLHFIEFVNVKEAHHWDVVSLLTYESNFGIYLSCRAKPE